MIRTAAALFVAAMLLSACAGPRGAVESLKPICDALGPPVEFNARDKDNAWHAGPALAPVLDERNRVGENLPCPGY